MKWKSVVLSGILVSAATGAMANGPTEADIRAILEAQTASINEEQRALRQRCRGGNFGHDSLLAIQCLTAAAGPTSIGLAGFRLVACEKANGRPGYLCDYRFSLSMNDPNVPGSLRGMMEQPQSCTGRFVKSGKHWEMVEREC